MITTKRIPVLAILTICVFTMADFVQSGFFLFPFPVYKGALFLIALLMIISRKQLPGAAGWLLLGWTLPLLLTSRLLLDIFMSEEEYAAFQDSLALDALYLLFCLLFGIWAMLISWKNRLLLLKVTGSLSAIVMMTLFVINYYDWAIVPLAIWCISVFYRSRNEIIATGFTKFLVFVFLTAWIMGYISGQSEQFRQEEISPVAYILYSM